MNTLRPKWCPHTESNCGLMLTRQLLYHLTMRAKIGAGYENRTHDIYLEGRHFTIKLILHNKGHSESFPTCLLLFKSERLSLTNLRNSPILLCHKRSIRPAVYSGLLSINHKLYHNLCQLIILVPTSRIERLSKVLQTSAMTTSAKSV